MVRIGMVYAVLCIIAGIAVWVRPAPEALIADVTGSHDAQTPITAPTPLSVQAPPGAPDLTTALEEVAALVKEPAADDAPVTQEVRPTPNRAGTAQRPGNETATGQDAPALKELALMPEAAPEAPVAMTEPGADVSLPKPPSTGPVANALAPASPRVNLSASQPVTERSAAGLADGQDAVASVSPDASPSRASLPASPVPAPPVPSAATVPDASEAKAEAERIAEAPEAASAPAAPAPVNAAPQQASTATVAAPRRSARPQPAPELVRRVLAIADAPAFSVASTADEIADVDGGQRALQGELANVRTVSAPASEPEPTAPVSQQQSAADRAYVVQPGDSLLSIAREVYGDSAAFWTIFQANRDVLESIDLVKTGQTLRIP